MRITAPRLRAESAMAFETAPMPPRTNPHNPRWPFTPPMQWCSRIYAVPGERGPPLAPITPSVASVTLSCFGLEPLVQEIGRALREDLHQSDDFGLATGRAVVPSSFK